MFANRNILVLLGGITWQLLLGQGILTHKDFFVHFPPLFILFNLEITIGGKCSPLKITDIEMNEVERSGTKSKDYNFSYILV